MWPDNRLTELLKIEHPIILAPMAGAVDAELAAEVSASGGLGSLPCAMLTPDTMRGEDSRPNRQAGECQFLLSQSTRARQRMRGALA